MKKKIYLSLLIGVLAILSGCNNTLENEVINTKELNMEDTKIVATEKDTLPNITPLVETEELKLLKEQAEKIKKMQLRSSSSYYPPNYDPNLSSNFWAIREMPFTITTDYNGSNKYLSTNGKGKELTFDKSRASRSIDVSQQFYLKVLPASSGIPYLLYSQLEKTPIRVGSYNNPQRYVLMTGKDNNESLFGASWNFVPANGFLAIQSQDILGQGDSGNWMDIFYYTAEVSSNDKTSMSKYTQNAKQHFKIQPLSTFYLSKVKFVNEYSAKITNTSKEKVTKPYTNDSYVFEDCDLFFDDEVKENSYFKETVSSIDFSRSIGRTFKVKAPEIANGKIFLEPSQNAEPSLPYIPNSYQTPRKKLNGKLLLTVKPRTRIDVTYWYSVYTIEAEYEAISTYNDREIKHTGTWSGKIYVDDIGQVEHTIKETNLDTNETRTIQLKITDNIKRINL